MKLVPYQPQWKAAFETEAELLRSLIGDAALQIEHIGSTAIPGMCSKPIIDLMVAIEDLNAAHNWITKLEQQSYEFRPNVAPPDRLFFAKGERSNRTHHLSVTEPDSVFFREKILFRDYLSNNDEAFDEYEELKTKLAEKFADKRENYTYGKEQFVRRILSLASE